MVVSSPFRFMISYLYFYNPPVGISESCKYFIDALIYNNIESGHPKWTPTIRVTSFDKETIFFNFRLGIGVNNFNDADEFSPVTNRERQRKQNFNSPCEKKAKELAANCSRSELDINYVTCNRKCV